jgi:hypothetical protein
MKVSWDYYSQYIQKNEKCSKPPTSDHEWLITVHKHDMGVSINGGIQKWLVYFMENPTKMDEDWRNPHFRNLHMPSIYQPQASPKRSSFR